MVVLLIGFLETASSGQPANTWDKVVFHLDEMRSARWALMLARSYLDDVPKAQIVFVAYGPGVDFLLEDKKDRHDDPYDYAVLTLAGRGVDPRLERLVALPQHFVEESLARSGRRELAGVDLVAVQSESQRAGPDTASRVQLQVSLIRPAEESPPAQRETEQENTRNRQPSGEPASSSGHLSTG